MFVFLGLGVVGLTWCEVKLTYWGWDEKAAILKVFKIIFLFESCFIIII